MCNACVIESVKKRMLSRRELLRGSAAAAVATGVAAGGLALPAPALAQPAMSVEDLTHTLTEDFPTFFGEQQFFYDLLFNYAEHSLNLGEFRVNEHTGTHMDAPLHFSADGQSVDAIPVADLVVPFVVVDIRAKAAENPDAQVTPDDLRAWTAQHGEISGRACVAMLSGWQDRLGTGRYRNADPEGSMHFPGFHVEAATMLMEETGAIGLAVDTLSLDHGPSSDFATHYAWLPTNRWGLECVANLDRLPPSGATLVVGAPKHRGGTGGPARLLALVP